MIQKYMKGENGDATLKVITAIAGSGILGVFAAGMISIANDAKIAIKVAEQHGQELLLMRGEVSSLRLEMMERTKDRFTAADGRYLEQQLRRIENDLDEHMKETGH